MNIIVTGLNGTVAPYAAKELEKHGHRVIKWDRTAVPTDSYAQTEKFIISSDAKFVFHIGMGPEQWAQDMAEVCFNHNIGYLFTSTLDVLCDRNDGPYTADTVPYSVTEYGTYKIRCEEMIRAVNKNAYIIRLGWQIGTVGGNNNMIDYLCRQMEENGVIKASSRWFVSCSYLWDTARALYEAVTILPPDTYLFNANVNMTFYDIVCLLSKQNPQFKVEEVTDFIRDDRMLDNRLKAEFLFSC